MNSASCSSRSIRSSSSSDLPATLPTFATVGAIVEQVEGVRFGEMFARLPQTYPDGAAAIAAVWELVQTEKAKRSQIATLIESLPSEMVTALRSGDETQLRAALEQLPANQRDAILAQLQTLSEASNEEELAPANDANEVLHQSEPLIQAIATVANGDDNQRAAIESVLADLEEKGWMLREPVARLWAGERDAAILTAGLEEQDATLIRQVLALLEAA